MNSTFFPRTCACRSLRLVILSLGLLTLAACGGNGGSNSNNAFSSGNSNQTVNNVQTIQVNLGPTNDVANGLYTSVTICAPGSTTQCQTINDVQVDTGSEGLRILASQLTVALPQIVDSSNNQIGECVVFADTSYTWGPLASADIRLSGEKAASVPVQVIGASGFPAVPTACGATGPADDTQATLGANGILGVGVFRQDCGSACAGPLSTVPNVYFTCPSSGCVVASIPLQFQLQNPVWLFPQDNNGLLISLPSIPAGGAPTASGSMIFGIGTQSNNALGSSQVYTTDGVGNFTTRYAGKSYSQSFIDSGSNGMYFLDHTTLSITECSGATAGFYCPASPVSFTATNVGANNVSAAVTFSIASADALFSAPGNAAFNDLGGDNPGSFDWGVPFFYGRKVFTGIEGQTSPGGPGPYWAY